MLQKFKKDENGSMMTLSCLYMTIIFIMFWILLLNYSYRGSGLNLVHLMSDAASRAGTVANAVEKQYSVREHMTGDLEYDFHVYTQLNRDESLTNVQSILSAWEEKHLQITDITYGDSTSEMTIPIWSYTRHSYDEVLPPKDGNINYKYDNGVCGIWVSAYGNLIEPETLLLPENLKYHIMVQSQASARGTVTAVR